MHLNFLVTRLAMASCYIKLDTLISKVYINFCIHFMMQCKLLKGDP